MTSGLGAGGLGCVVLGGGIICGGCGVESSTTCCIGFEGVVVISSCAGCG